MTQNHTTMTDEEIQAAVKNDTKIMEEHWKKENPPVSKKEQVIHFLSKPSVAWAVAGVLVLILILSTVCDGHRGHKRGHERFSGPVFERGFDMPIPPEVFEKIFQDISRYERFR